MINVETTRCTGCAVCVTVCPEDALSCFGLAEVDENCTDCLICVDHCPSGALSGASDREEPNDRAPR